MPSTTRARRPTSAVASAATAARPAPAPAPVGASPTSAQQAARFGHSFGRVAPGPGAPIQRVKLDDQQRRGAYLRQATETPAAFRTRMAAEMAALRATAAAKDAGTAPHAAADLVDLPQGFLDVQRSAREAELAKLRADRPVTSGATRGSAALAGVGKVPILSGGAIGALEHRLNHPDPSVRQHLGMVERQRQVMKVAAAADPFMRALESGSDLSASHRMRSDVVGGGGTLKAGYKFGPRGVEDTATGATVHAVGAKEFGNRPTRGQALPGADARGNPDAVERLLPQLANPQASPGTGVQSRVGRWSEADVTPLTQQGSTGKVKGRDEMRLLHTAATSQQIDPSTGKSVPVSSRYWVTSDHYNSAVPVSPLPATRYRPKGTNSSPYRDPSGKLSSLQYHDVLAAEQERARARRELEEAQTGNAGL